MLNNVEHLVLMFGHSNPRASSVTCGIMHALYILTTTTSGKESTSIAFVPCWQQHATRGRTQPRPNRQLARFYVAHFHQNSGLRIPRGIVTATTAGGDARSNATPRHAHHPPNSNKKFVGAWRRGWSYSDDPVKVKVTS